MWKYTFVFGYFDAEENTLEIPVRSIFVYNAIFTDAYHQT